MTSKSDNGNLCFIIKSFACNDVGMHVNFIDSESVLSAGDNAHAKLILSETGLASG